MTDRELLQAIYGEVHGMKDDISELKKDVSVLKTEMAEVKADIAELKADVSGLKADVSELKADVLSLKEGVVSLDRRVTSLELTIENEIRKNIRIIAEGHLELVRKLDEALKTEQENEMMRLRVTVLENDMRIVKDKVGISA